MANVLKELADTIGLSVFTRDIINSGVGEQLDAMEATLRGTADQFLLDMAKMQTSNPGTTKAATKQVIKDIQSAMTGMFADFRNELVLNIDKATGDIIATIDEPVIAEEMGLDYAKGQKLMWQAMFVNTCPDCQRLHGQVHTRAYWDKNGHPGSSLAGTVCNGHCKCVLIPSQVKPDDNYSRAVKLQTKKIRRAERARGKKYSKSYVSQILGSINNPEKRMTKDGFITR